MSTPARSGLPQPDALAKLLASLFDKKIHVVKSTSPLPTPAQRGVCDYVDGQGQVHFIVTCDMAFLAGIGAALAMIPPAVVAEAVKSGKPSDALRENAYEVFNIAASIFNEVDGATLHVKLRALTLAPPIPPPIVPKMAKPVGRLDLDVTIPGYPVGKVALLAIA